MLWKEKEKQLSLSSSRHRCRIYLFALYFTCAFLSQSLYIVSKLGSLWRGCEYILCSNASTFWMTFFSPWSLIPMSSIGSNNGTPSGNRFCTSLNVNRKKKEDKISFSSNIVTAQQNTFFKIMWHSYRDVKGGGGSLVWDIPVVLKVSLKGDATDIHFQFPIPFKTTSDVTQNLDKFILN